MLAAKVIFSYIIGALLGVILILLALFLSNILKTPRIKRKKANKDIQRKNKNVKHK